LYPRLLQLGHVGIPTYGVLSAVALLAALTLAMRFARRLDLRSDKVWSMGLLAILVALVGERLLLILAHLAVFRAHPFWILGLTTVRSAWIVPCSALLSIAAAVLYAKAEGLPLLRTADAAAPALAAAFAINRAGAFCAGIAYGTPTQLPWGVTYRSFIAAFWYRVPLGVKFHPVQLYDAAASLAIFALLLWWLPRRRQDGELAGLWLFLYGLSVFFLSFCRGDLDRPILLHSIATAAVIAGAALWLERSSASRRYTALHEENHA
jgi:phosphatidylglycerol:prolipoprotein diacylglycerol transferase